MSVHLFILPGLPWVCSRCAQGSIRHMREQNLGLSFLDLSHPGCPAVFNCYGSPASVFPIPRPERPSSRCLVPHAVPPAPSPSQRLLCPVPSSPSPADPLLLTAEVQKLQVFSFNIMIRFCYPILQGNQSLVARCGSPLVESQGPLSVPLSPNQFLEGEGKRGELLQRWVPSGSLPYQLRVLGPVTPVGSVFLPLEPGAIGAPDKGPKVYFLQCWVQA